ncbi:MAG: LCP family protein [Bacilli bacterium]
MRHTRHEAKRKKKRKILRIVLVVVLLLLLVFGIYVGRIFLGISNMFGDSDDPKHKAALGKIKNGDPITVLMMGVDERNGDSGRSDSLIVAQLNPKDESTLMFNIPRDTRTELVCRGTEDKINHAYAFGKIPCTVDSVEKLIDFPVDYYVKVNMEGLQEVIEAIGGIEVDNAFAWSDKGFDYPEGKITINGKQAMWYVRMRKLDPEGDFGRQKRQQQVITAIADKVMSPSTVWNLPDIAKVIGKNVETNLPMSTAIPFANKYYAARKTIDQRTLEGDGQTIGGVWYYIADDASLQSIRSELKTHDKE